jgi:hypothetical protein
MTGRKQASAARRVRKAVEGFRTCAEVIGEIEAGMALFVVTRGQISMIDVVTYLVGRIGPCEVSVWTWCIADYEVEAFERLLRERAISRAELIVDRSAEQRNVDLLDRWRDRFGVETVRVCMNHAKIATVFNERFRFLVRGSMNLNFNPRFEQFDLSEGDAAFDLVRAIEAEIPVLPRLSSRRQADGASGLREAWSGAELREFSGVKVWHK